MLRREITFRDFNGDMVTETHYFNMTETELTMLEVSFEGGLEKTIKKIEEKKDAATLLGEFRKIILMSYGERTADGKHFLKSEERSAIFEQSGAYNKLFMDLISDEEFAAQFIQGLIPEELSSAVDAKKKELQEGMADALGTRPKTAAELAAEQA